MVVKKMHLRLLCEWFSVQLSLWWRLCFGISGCTFHRNSFSLLVSNVSKLLFSGFMVKRLHLGFWFGV